MNRPNTFAAILVASCVALFAPSAGAACSKRQYTEPEQVRLRGDSVLIVTHPSSTFDARMASKRGIDEAVRHAKSQRIPVVYLVDDPDDKFYFVDDCKPDYWVLAKDGEVRFPLTASRVYIAGGHLEMCLSNTVHDVLLAWSRQPQRNFTLTYFMDGVYSNGRTIEPTDAYYPDFQQFMSVVSYGRPGGEHWPKLSLLETMGVIKKDDHEVDYATKVLPHYARTMSGDYRVELKMNDRQFRVLRPGSGRGAPTLRFHFVDSALVYAH